MEIRKKGRKIDCATLILERTKITTLKDQKERGPILGVPGVCRSRNTSYQNMNKGKKREGITFVSSPSFFHLLIFFLVSHTSQIQHQQAGQSLLMSLGHKRQRLENIFEGVVEVTGSLSGIFTLILQRIFLSAKSEKNRSLLYCMQKQRAEDKMRSPLFPTQRQTCTCTGAYVQTYAHTYPTDPQTPQSITSSFENENRKVLVPLQCCTKTLWPKQLQKKEFIWFQMDLRYSSIIARKHGSRRS